MMTTQHADTLIKNAYVVTVDTGRRVFTNGFLAFVGGKIAAVGPMDACDFTADDVIDGTDKLVMPGMINSHNHLNQIFLRGYNDDRWPTTDIPKAVATVIRHMDMVTARTDEERSHVLTRLHALDMVRLGFTGTHDEHFNNTFKTAVDGSWSALRESGMRGFVARCVVNSEMVGEAGREDIDEGLAEVERLRAKFSSERIEVAASFINFNFVKTREDMRRIGEGARRMGARLDIDMTDNSRGVGLKKRGWDGGQVELYQSLDLLVEPIYAGKAVNVLPRELPLLAHYDCRLGLVPVLRMMDAVGIPLHHLFKLGMLPGLGTDAPMVSDNQSPFEIMRHVIFSQNLAIRREMAEGAELPERALWATSERVIEMATLGGARTLFMEDVCGSLEVGKAADCVIVELDLPGMRPNYGGLRTLGSLVWAADTQVVDTVYVDGRKLLSGGRSTIWDEDEVIDEAERVLAEIASETDLPSLLAPRNPGQTHRGWTYI